MNHTSGGAKKAALLFLPLLLSVVAIGQEKSTEINVNINKKGDAAWYTASWVWIVGGAIFLLLLVALLRGNKSGE